jgi:undecaprenyl-diphosphatase
MGLIMEKKSLNLAVSIVLLLSFYSTFLLARDGRPEIDHAINELVDSAQNSLIIAIAEAMAYIFDPIVLAGIGMIAAIYLWLKKEKKKSITLAITIFITAISLKIMKSFFALERPLNMLVSETGYAFPSGHSAMIIVLLGTLIAMCYKKIRHKKLAIILSAVFSLIIGLSRIFLNVHWLTDILGGYLFGAFMISLAALIYPKSIL